MRVAGRATIGLPPTGNGAPCGARDTPDHTKSRAHTGRVARAAPVVEGRPIPCCEFAQRCSLWHKPPTRSSRRHPWKLPRSALSLFVSAIALLFLGGFATQNLTIAGLIGRTGAAFLFVLSSLFMTCTFALPHTSVREGTVIFAFTVGSLIAFFSKYWRKVIYLH